MSLKHLGHRPFTTVLLTTTVRLSSPCDVGTLRPSPPKVVRSAPPWPYLSKIRSTSSKKIRETSIREIQPRHMYGIMKVRSSFSDFPRYGMVSPYRNVADGGFATAVTRLKNHAAELAKKQILLHTTGA